VTIHTNKVSTINFTRWSPFIAVSNFIVRCLVSSSSSTVLLSSSTITSFIFQRRHSWHVSSSSSYAKSDSKSKRRRYSLASNIGSDYSKYSSINGFSRRHSLPNMHLHRRYKINCKNASNLIYTCNSNFCIFHIIKNKKYRRTEVNLNISTLVCLIINLHVTFE
jgi:hypothetical protein